MDAQEPDELILAPMVRACSLPFRALCREYGATSCYTAELIDRKLVATCTRRERLSGPRRVCELYCSKDRVGVFATCMGPGARSSDHPLVAQIGTASPETAVAAARLLVSAGADGVDVNLGCPVHFSTHGGMGAALVQRPDAVRDIVRALSRELAPSGRAVSAKMRLHATPAETAAFVREYLAPAGCATVAIHARTAREPYTAPPRWEELGAVRALLAASPETARLRLIANGGVRTRADVDAMRAATGIRAVMIGRAAIENASIFAEQQLPYFSVAQRFLELCVDFDNSFATTKFIVLQMMLSLPKSRRDKTLVERLNKTKTVAEIWCARFSSHHFHTQKAHTCSALSLIEANTGKSTTLMNRKHLLLLLRLHKTRIQTMMKSIDECRRLLLLFRVSFFLLPSFF